MPYDAWARAGHIEPTPGAATDYRYIVRRLAEIATHHDLKAVAFDRWRIEDLKRELDRDGVKLPLVEVIQGLKSFSPAVDELDRLVADRRLVHGGHPILNWNISSAVLESDAAGNRKPTKAQSREKIDGLVALLMAVGVMRRHEPVAVPWCLTHGPLVVGL